MAFNGLNTLENIHIAHNRLNKAPYISNVKSTILRLDLSWNEISQISDTYFHFCKKIKYIFLNNNHLVAIPKLKYVSGSIFVLNLAVNNISNMIPIYGIHFPRLHALYLGANRIRSFCFPSADFAPMINFVDLHSNYLQRIAFPRANNSHRYNVRIQLKQNPWYCNASLDWTQQCTQDAHVNVMTCMEWLSVDGMICAGPPEAQGLTPKEAGGILYI